MRQLMARPSCFTRFRLSRSAVLSEFFIPFLRGDFPFYPVSYCVRVGSIEGDIRDMVVKFDKGFRIGFEVTSVSCLVGELLVVMK